MTDEDLKAHAAVILAKGPAAIHMIPAATAAYMVHELLAQRQLDIGGPDLGALAAVAGIRQPEPPVIGRVLEFRLSGPTPLLNETLRKHWSKRMRDLRATAYEVNIALRGKRPQEPFARAAIEVARHSVRAPDKDGMYGGVKSLLDVLQPYVAPDPETGKGGRPYGLGIIAGDDPARLQLDVRHVGCRKGEACTMVTIRELLS